MTFEESEGFLDLFVLKILKAFSSFKNVLDVRKSFKTRNILKILTFEECFPF